MSCCSVDQSKKFRNNMNTYKQDQSAQRAINRERNIKRMWRTKDKMKTQIMRELLKGEQK